jgi:ribosomal protein S7
MRVGGATIVPVKYQRNAVRHWRCGDLETPASVAVAVAEKLAGELMDAFNGQGASVKKRRPHRMAEANVLSRISVSIRKSATHGEKDRNTTD